MPLRDYIVTNWNRGTITRIEDESIPKGAASASKNWLTLGDHIELRRGYAVKGTANAGTGRITGLFVGRKFNGDQLLLKTYLRKMKYYDETTDDFIEVSTADILPTAASGEDVAFSQYHSLAGAIAYASSPNSSIYKIMLANPANVIDMTSISHRGKIKIKQNRMFLWDRKDTNGGSDKSGLYGSYIDKDELSDYTEVLAESVGTGTGAQTTFTGSLAAIATTPRTAMYVRITDGTETFVDDRNGVLSGSAGGTGTINYATGAFSVTFAVAPANLQAITASYYWENAKSLGICDFSKSSPRTAGQGFVFRQDDGGVDFQNIGSIGGDEYCLHVLKTWKLTLSQDDTDATNLIYRSKVGIPNWRAMVETGEGIYYVDATDENNPFIRLLQISYASTEVIPRSISDSLDLSPYRFDRSAMFRWGDYVVVACRTSDSTINDTLLLYHRLWKTWDIMDYRASTLEEYDGGLICGDDGSNNVFSLFDGFSDEEANIANYWRTGKSNLEYEGVKKFYRFVISGLISPDQILKIRASYDNGTFTEIGEIRGDGDYVDQGNAVTIGSHMIGNQEIGGGGDGIEASPYRREIRIASDKFEQVQFEFEATQIGYVSISEYQVKDVRYKGRKLPSQYIG